MKLGRLSCDDIYFSFCSISLDSKHYVSGGKDLVIYMAKDSKRAIGPNILSFRSISSFFPGIFCFSSALECVGLLILGLVSTVKVYIYLLSFANTLLFHIG